MFRLFRAGHGNNLASSTLQLSVLGSRPDSLPTLTSSSGFWVHFVAETASIWPFSASIWCTFEFELDEESDSPLPLLKFAALSCKSCAVGLGGVLGWKWRRLTHFRPLIHLILCLYWMRRQVCHFQSRIPDCSLLYWKILFFLGPSWTFERGGTFW